MHVNVPSVAAASGLVNVSSVGMFGVIFDAVGRLLLAAEPARVRREPMSSDVPGPRSSSPVSPSFVSFARGVRGRARG